MWDHWLPPPQDRRPGPPADVDLPSAIVPDKPEDLPRWVEPRVQPCVGGNIEIRVGPWWRWRRWHTATAATAATISWEPGECRRLFRGLARTRDGRATGLRHADATEGEKRCDRSREK